MILCASILFSDSDKLMHPPLHEGSWDLVTRVMIKVNILIVAYQPIKVVYNI